MELLNDNLFEMILEQESYQTGHTAPGKENTAPLYNLSGAYQEDIYSSKAASYYGDRSNDYSDDQALYIIRAARNNPKFNVTMYRAVPVPKQNIENKKKINELKKILLYYDKFGSFPMKDKISRSILYSLLDSGMNYEEVGQKTYDIIKNNIEELKNSNLKEIDTINNGDWVTLTKDYAVSHGVNVLNGMFKILSKKTTADKLYTDGNSIHEWGYNE